MSPRKTPAKSKPPVKKAKAPAKRPAKSVPAAASDRFVIIMAGGRGERFWPVSRQSTPKQLIKLLGDKSFLQQAVDNVLPLAPIENICVITNEAQAAEVRRQLPNLPKANVIAEPCGRDTCAAVALGAAWVGARCPTAVMAVLPADHVIPDAKKFRQTLSDCFAVAARGQVIVTIGIQPAEPATGYGYIHVGDPLPAPGKTVFHRAVAFVEKPTLAKAEEYVSSGRYRWNAGMFVWSFVTVEEGFLKHQPAMHAACQRWFQSALKPARLARVLAEDYPSIPKISIDYALLEKARNVVVADGDFAWDDLGSWTALARHLEADAQGNSVQGQFIHVDAARNIIFDARSVGRRTPIAVVGLSDTILVQTDDAVLMAHRSHAQKIKELVRKMSESEPFRSLV